MRSSRPVRAMKPMRQLIAVGASLLAMAASAAPGSDALALELRGKQEQGALLIGQVAPGTRVQLDGRSVRTTASGAFAIGFDRDAAAQAQLTLTAADGRSRSEALHIQPRDYVIQRVTGVPQRTVEPPPEELERIRREQQLVERARAVDSDREDFAGAFAWPLQGPISGVYGSQRIYNGKAGRPHYGVDVAAPIGTPVRAPAAATVVLAEPDLFFSGGTLIMDHGYGVSSTFMHLSRLLVKTGEQIQAGQVVAEVGATGRATGPHLDWRINWFGIRLDPQLLPRLPEATVAAGAGRANATPEAAGAGRANATLEAAGAGRANATPEAAGAGRANATPEAAGAGRANTTTEAAGAAGVTTKAETAGAVRAATGTDRAAARNAEIH